MVPLQIRITDHEARLTAAAVPYGVSVVQDMEFAFIVDVDGEMQVMSPYEFACHSAVCAPPNKNGTGGLGGTEPKAGSGGGGKYAPKKGFVGSAEHQADIEVVTKGEAGGRVRADGILAEPWLDDDGNVVLTPAQEKAAHKKLAEMGLSYQELMDNAIDTAVTSMNNDEKAAQADAVWYQHEHDTWGVPLAKEHGVSVDQIMGITSVTSTLKSWDGPVGSGTNKEACERILTVLKDDKPVTITAKMAEAYNSYSFNEDGSRSTGNGGKYGPETIKPGELKPSQMSSGMLARVMGTGYGIGGLYGTDGLFKAFAIARGELAPNQAIPSLKQRSFFNNLAHPDINYSSTNDFWMVRVMFGNKKLNLEKGHPPETVREWETRTKKKPNQFIGSDKTGSSSLFAMMTKAAKEALGTLSKNDKRFAGYMIHQFQAVDWVQEQTVYRGLGLVVD